jgi:YggT family protein
MIIQIVQSFFNLFFTVLYFAIIARALVSWLPIDPYHPIIQILNQITEPFLAPIRRFVPSVGMMDITPIVGLILIRVLQAVLNSILAPYVR